MRKAILCVLAAHQVKQNFSTNQRGLSLNQIFQALPTDKRAGGRPAVLKHLLKLTKEGHARTLPFWSHPRSQHGWSLPVLHITGLEDPYAIEIIKDGIVTLDFPNGVIAS